MSRVDDLIKENISENGEILTLKEKMLGFRGTMELAGKEALSKVKVFVFSGNQCADEGVEALLDSPYLANLETLNLNHNEIGDDGAISLANTKKLPKLNNLS